MEQKPLKEEVAVVLDILPNGYPFDPRPTYKKTAIVQALGAERFVLLELVPKKEALIRHHEEIYIGEGKRDKIHHINGRLPVNKLTGTAKTELQFVVEDIVNKDEKKFADFFNKAQSLSTRMHQIELLPGVGKKHMWQIIEERKDRPFESFEDIKKRVKLIPDPKRAIIKRIMIELEGDQKHNLFVD